MENKIEILLAYTAAGQLSCARYLSLMFWLKMNGEDYVKQNFKELIKQAEEEVTSSAQRILDTMFNPSSDD